MLRTGSELAGQRSFLANYAERLGAVVSRNQARAALVHAKNQAEAAAMLSREAALQARAADAAKTEFLTSMSHELRTPLNAIIGFSELIATDVLGDIPPEQRKSYAEDIRTAGVHLLSIINDILDLAKIEAGKCELPAEAVSLKRITAAAAAMVRGQAATKGVALTVDAIPGSIAVSGDERRLKQVVINLLSNAIKFTDTGEIRVTIGSSGDTAVLTVRDTGIGIAAEDLQRVLQPFVQAGNSLTRGVGGTGIGLPLAKSIVELHGGTLTLDSRHGHGTTVTVSLPLRAAVQAAA